MSPDVTTRWSGASARLTLIVVAMLSSLLLYGRVFSASFVSDDFDLLALAATFRPADLLTPYLGGFFRPVARLFIHLQLRLWGPDPHGYHLVAAALHGVNATLVMALAGMLLRAEPAGQERGRTHVAFVAGLIYLVLACHVEAVAWIACAADLLATLFGLLCLVALLRAHTRGCVWLGAALLACGLALLCKESAVAVPLLAVALETARARRGQSARTLAVCGAFLILLAAYFGVRDAVLGDLLAGHNRGVWLNLDPLRVARHLVLFSARTVLPPLALTWAIPLLGGVLLVSWGMYRTTGGPAAEMPPTASQKRAIGPWPLAGLFVVALIPVLTLGLAEHSTESERHLYLPSIFAAMLLALPLSSLIDALPKAGRVALAVFVLGQTLLCTLALEHWRTAGELAQRVVRVLSSSRGPGRDVVLNLPDSFRGAYVLANGIDHAVQLFDGMNAAASSRPPIAVVAWQVLLDAEAEARVSPTPDSTSVTYQVSLERKGAFFVDLMGIERRAFLDPGYAVQQVRPTRMMVRLHALHPEDRTWWFSAGRLHRLRRPR
jgi:protein O-mannosyl-transferase